MPRWSRLQQVHKVHSARRVSRRKSFTGNSAKPRRRRLSRTRRKIAQAAARYLEDLTRLFGRDADAMTLAMLAYNCGETCATRAITELKAMNFQPISFWTLLENNERLSVPLSAESQNYAPRFFAAAILGENPQRF